jgi:hypothetical protein
VNPRFPSACVLFVLTAAGALVDPVDARARGCGTSRLVQTSSTPGSGLAPAARMAAGSWSGRVLTTAHFAVHYTLAPNAHQPLWKAGDLADSLLRQLRDSLWNAGAADADQREARVHAALDSLGAGHPAFIARAAAHLENAYAYYVDTLGMRAPVSGTPKFYSAAVPGKFNVDVVNIDALYQPSRDWEGTYGVTERPTGFGSALVLENDFLYRSSVDAKGKVTGIPIRVDTGKTLLHDYHVDWDEGLAVTVAHELYHAVQFRYSARSTGACFHAWYELGGVAMEERLAPDVNDYFQYLPYLLPYDPPVSLLETCGTDGNYANGIFHTYLTRLLGRDFDVRLWERLGVNGNDLPAALVHVAGSQARWDSLYAAYAASLALAGLPASAASPLAFSPDFPRWPKPRFYAAPAKGSTILGVAKATYRLVRPVEVPTSVSFTGTRGAWRVVQNGPAVSASPFADSSLSLVANGTVALAVPNASFTSNASLTLARAAAASAPVTAFPNPAPRAAARIHFTALQGGSTSNLLIVSESGRRVATLPPDPAGSFWTWNVGETPGGAPPPGLYYYARSGEKPQTLLRLP